MSEEQIASIFRALEKLTGMVGSLQQGQVGMQRDIATLNEERRDRKDHKHNYGLMGFSAIASVACIVLGLSLAKSLGWF